MPETSKGKRQKGEAVMVNRLRDLPDSVLSHILSFLPTEPKLVATSLVSRRWRNLWTWVHTLDFKGRGQYGYAIFKDDGGYRTIDFVKFVHGVMRSVKGSIKQFRLAFDIDDHLVVDEQAVENWISIAIDKGVESLSLNFWMSNMRVPSCLFNSKTLVDLELLDIDISDMDTPGAYFFPNLKKLHILDAWSNNPVTLTKLIAGCSALEQLRLHLDCYITLNISSLTLKKLELEHSHDDNFGNKIVLAVPSLELLKMKCFPREFLIEDQISSLVEVDICLYNNYTEFDDLSRVSFERSLQLMSSVKILRLDFWFDKPLTSPMNAQYNNLTELKIVSSFFEGALMRSLLERSINLESLTLEQNRKNPNKEHQVLWKEPQDVPQCLVSSLRMVSLTGYCMEDELDMVKYVLENAQVLERMDIRCLGNKGDYKLKFQVLQKIVMIQRASRCQISFV